MERVVIVCGPPAVGKTTVATLLSNRLREWGLFFRLLDSDVFSRNTYEKMYERVANSDDDWIVTGTFYQRRWQERFEEFDPFIVYLRADLETCLERNRGLDPEDGVDDEAVHPLAGVRRPGRGRHDRHARIFAGGGGGPDRRGARRGAR